MLFTYCVRRFLVRYSKSSTKPSLIAELPNFRHVETIQEYIGIEPERIKKTLGGQKYLILQTINEKDIRERLNVIKEMRLADQSTLKMILLLRLHRHVLENRYHSLREYGFIPYKIAVYHIKRFFSLCKSTVLTLKRREFIGKEQDVLRSLWKAADLDMNTCPNAQENATLHDLKEIALEAFMKEKVGLSDEEWNLNKQCLMSRLKTKSFHTLKTNLHLFRNIIGLSEFRLKNNLFVFHYNPQNTVDLLNRVRTVASVDMKIILQIYPKITTMPAKNLEKIIEYIESSGIELKLVQRRLDIFTLNCESVRTRLSELWNKEYFLMNIKNPRVFDLVYYQVKAKKRLAILDDMKLHPTMTSLANTEEFFEKFCEKGAYSYKYETMHYVIAELNIPQEEFLKKIKRHHRWSKVPIIEVGRNLQELRKYFSDGEIKKHIYVLFYFSARLNMELEKLETHEGLEEFKENGKIKKEYALPFLLYFLEKESNFTGESIWDPEDFTTDQDLPDLPVIAKS